MLLLEWHDLVPGAAGEAAKEVCATGVSAAEVYAHDGGEDGEGSHQVDEYQQRRLQAEDAKSWYRHKSPGEEGTGVADGGEDDGDPGTLHDFPHALLMGRRAILVCKSFSYILAACWTRDHQMLTLCV